VSVLLAGLPVENESVHELADRLRLVGESATAEKLEDALTHDKPDVALTIHDRGVILTVLHEAPDGLAQLRAVLLAEHVSRKNAGLD
jgi:hypothetical protein